MFSGIFERIFGYNHKIHCMKFLASIGEHILAFLGINVAITSIVYFVGIQYSHQAFSLGNYLFIVFILSLLLDIFIPLLLFLLACCEMFAEYLACLLFPR